MLTTEVQSGTANADGTGTQVRGGYGAQNASFLVAVSTSSDPLGLDTASGTVVGTNWNFYKVTATYNFGTGLAYADGVKFAADANYVYVTASYRLFGSQTVAGVLVSRFDKAFDSGSRVDSAAPAGVTALTPVQNTGPNASTAAQVFVDAVAAVGVRVWSLDSSGNLVATPAVVAGTTFTSHTGGAHQEGTSLRLDTGGDRITSAVEWNGSIYAANTVDVGGLATVQWYQVIASNDTLIQMGDATDTASGTRTLETYLPAIAVDSSGNVGLTYTESSTSVDASFVVTVHPASDTTGLTPIGTVVQAGEGPFKPGANPLNNLQYWGNSAGIAVDPWDGQTFWATGEYAGTNSIQNAWGTYFASFAAIGNDRFHTGGGSNGTFATATNIGVGPGINLTNLALNTPGESEYYSFTVLRQSDIAINLDFLRAQGDLSLTVYHDVITFSASGQRQDSYVPVLYSSSSFDTSKEPNAQLIDNEVAQLAGLDAGVYVVLVKASPTHPTDTNNYSLSIVPLNPATNRVFYVNDQSNTNDYYALAPGNDANSGLSPYAPMASVQKVLATYNVGPTDLIKIDTGTYGGSTVTIDQAHEGAVYAGSPGGTTFSGISGSDEWDLDGAQQNIIYGLTFSGNYRGIYAYSSSISQPASNNYIADDTFVNNTIGIEIDGGAGNTVRGNTITGSGYYGVYMPSGGGATIGEDGSDSPIPTDANTIQGLTYAIYVSGSYSTTGAANVLVRGNTVSRTVPSGSTPTPGTYGIIAQDGTITVLDNNVSGFDTGIYVANGLYYYYSSQIGVSDNDVGYNTIGVDSNFYFYNYYGTNTSSIFGNSIHDNATGLTGTGTLGGSDWSAGQANLIYNNVVGVNANTDDVVQFNRIFNNTTGVQVLGQSSVNINHNLIYNSPGSTALQGVLDSGSSDVTFEGNTFYAPVGDAIDIENSASNTTVHDNILWAQSGYDLNVANDSQVGFASDYNNLFTSGTGRIVHWQKDFTDLYDWQVEANYDNHSIGYTQLAPTLDNPLFMDVSSADPSQWDFRLKDASTPGPISTSIDAGDPASLFNLEPTGNGVYNGGRIDLGAYGDTAQAADSPASYIRIDYPNFYTDWEVNAGHSILWHTYNVTGNVAIDLYEQGPNPGQLTFVTNIGIVPASTGYYGWSPQASGITPSTTARYQIVLTVVNDNALTATSREGFSVPISGNTYYVNNNTSLADDYYTTALGNNRNTGKTPGDPKADILPILHSYFVGPGDTVLIDSGDYVEVRNVVLSGDPSLGSGQGATFLGPDPNAPTDSNFPTFVRPAFDAATMVATLDRQNTFNQSTDIELNQGSFITLGYLTLTGAQTGLWVHDGSTNFTGIHLTASNNTANGITIESDAQGTSVDALTAFGNGGDGISIATPIASLSNSTSYDNAATGIDLTDTGATVLVDDQVYSNAVGISVSNSIGTTVIGNPDLALNQGNLIYGNTNAGIEAVGGVTIVGNSIYNQTNGTGLVLGGMGYSGTVQALDNVIYGNASGVSDNPCSSEVISANLIYNNSGTAITAYSDDVISQNVIYGNGNGVVGEEGICDGYPMPFSGQILNNLIYNNYNATNSTGAGITIVTGSGAQILNNTVVQNGGDALDVSGGTTGLQVRDNIFEVNSGYVLNVATDSQTGFASDYNDLYATGTGNVSIWQGVSGQTLTAWYYTSYNDKHSLSTDPLFVNPSSGDYHLQSLYGSDHGGTLAPVLNTITGLPVANPGTTGNLDAQQSPAIDRGAPGDPFANEPAPNGNYVNLGAYGNTAQASLSPLHYLLVTSPAGGETFPLLQTFTITWRAESLTTTANPTFVNIDLVQGSTVTSIMANAPDTGSYAWTLSSGLTPGANYKIRVTRTAGLALPAFSNPFTIAPVTHDYYVAPSTNPANTDATNNGLSPLTPKASIRALLEAYDLQTINGVRNVIHVAPGTYNLTTDILVTARAAGVEILGNGGEGVQNRGTTLYPVFEITGAAGVTINDLGMTNGSYGLLVENSPSLTLTNSEVYANPNGVSLDANSGGWLAQGNNIHNNSGTGFAASSTGTLNSGNVFTGNGTGADVTGAGTLVSGNTFTGNSTGVSAAGSGTQVLTNTVTGGSTGIAATGPNVTVSGNTVTGASTGISVSGGVLVGGSNASAGNQVTGNTTGISAVSGNTIEYNTVSNNAGSGISTALAGVIAFNTVFNNGGDGIVTDPGTAQSINDNTVYHNTSVGIYAHGSDVVTGNDVYSNGVGIQGQGGASNYTGGYYVPFSGTIQNDLVYANASNGIVLIGANGALVQNDTVYQQAGNAVQVLGDTSYGEPSQNVTVQNNILSTQSSTTPTTESDLFVSSDAEAGFSSDYNELQWLGTAHLGNWQGVSFDSWSTWYYQVGQDHHSLTQDQTPSRGDPMFVNPAGPDGILGYSTQPVGSAQIIDDSSAGFSTTGTGWTTISGAGLNGEFMDHAGTVSVPDATASWTFTNLTPGTYTVAVTYVPGSFYDSATGQYKYYYGTVPYTVLGDNGVSLGTTQVYQGSSPSDFTDAGVGWKNLTGDFTITGTTLTVQMTDAIGYYGNYASYGYGANADAVLIQQIQGNKGADDDFHLQSTSPAIDAGDPASPFANEPAPNGGRVNLGYDGNTAAAATSKTPAIQVLSPAGLEKYPIGQTINVTFLTSGEAAGDTVKLEYSINDGNTYVDPSVTGTVGANGHGTIAWTLPVDSSLETVGNSVLVRLTVVADGTQGVSNNPFQIVDNNDDFYLSPTGLDTQSGKDPAHPMENLAALLAAYQLTSADTVHFEAGSYALLRNAVLTSANSGVHLQGPTNGQALINRGVQLAGDDVIDLVGATNVAIDRLALSGGYYGINADANSSGLSFTNGAITGNSTGAYLAGAGAYLYNNLVYDNGTTTVYYYGSYFTPGPGIVIYGANASIQTNQVYNNSDGIDDYAAGAMIQNNQVYGNSSTGIVVGAEYGSSVVPGTIVSGNQVSSNYDGISAFENNDNTPADQILVQNNTVSKNSSIGINAGGNVLVQNNQVGDQGSYGIYLNGGEAKGNVVFRNDTGIFAYSDATVDGNRVFANTTIGIDAHDSTTVTGNQVYSNSTGVRGSAYYSSFTGLIANNLIYANTSTGVEIDDGFGDAVTNNTIYNPIGNALVVQQSTSNISIENNVLWVDTGAVFVVDSTSETGFHSDYNFLSTTGGAIVGNWQGQNFATQADWYYGVGADQHSQTGNPMLGDPTLANPVAGPDQVLGYSTAPAGPAQIIDDSSTTGFSTTGTGWTTYTGAGYNNEFMDHAGSYSGDATASWTFTGLTPGVYQVAVTYVSAETDYPSSPYYYATVPYSVLGDNGTNLGTTQVYQGTPPNDFTDGGVGWQQLPGVFTITGTTLTVQMSDAIGYDSDYGYHVNADAVLIQRIQGDGGLDDNFHPQAGSPTIDMGDPASAFANEPAPNGGRVNVGYDGNTAAAAKSPAELVQVLSPAGFEKLQLGQTVNITYRSQGVSAGTTYTVALSTDGGLTYQTLFSAAPAVNSSGNGSVSWTVPNNNALLTTGNTALVRVTANDGSHSNGVSTHAFLIANAGHDYYLSPTGNDSNSGKTPDQPMFSMAAMASAYAFKPGDTIHVATGTYNLVRDVQLTAADSGAPGSPVTIQGPTDGTAAIIDRGNTLGTVLSINGATDLTINNLTLQGGGTGLSAVNGSDGLTVSNSEIRDNQNAGVYDDATGSAPYFNNDLVHDNGYGTGLEADGNDAKITGNTVYNNGTGIAASGSGAQISANIVYSNGTWISVGGQNTDQATVINNTVYDNTGTGIYAYGTALVSGNTVYDQTSGTGIDLSSGEARQNTVYGNEQGIYAYGGTVDGNRVFDNSGTGITAYNATNVVGNYVYSNQNGILATGEYYYGASFTGSVLNNLVYANQVDGIEVQYAGTGAQVVNNTVYTPVGNALHLLTTSGVTVIRNNILAVDAGYDIFAEDTAGTIQNSDYNLFSTGVAGSAGFLAMPIRSLAGWQTASGQDAHSVAGDPMFVNAAGNDNTLGYTTAGTGHDGGRDDNFYLDYSSPAATTGDPSVAPATDIEGFPRPVPGSTTVSIGAYQFRGSVADGNSTPPTVTVLTALGDSTVALPDGTQTIAHIRQIQVTFSEDVNPIDVMDPFVYQLSSTTQTDLVFDLTPEKYVPGSKTETLDIALPAGTNALPPDTYQFTVFSEFTKSVHDLEGTPLKGNTSVGFQSTFTVLPLISVTPTSGLTTSDNGGSATFQVVLNQQPTASVTIPLHINAADGVARGSFAAGSLDTTSSVTFTTANWNTPQTVTVYGLDDHIDEGSDVVTYTVVTDPAVSTDPSFNNLNPADVTVTAQNDDVAGLTVTAAPNLTVTGTGAGSQATFTVVLNTIPRAPVTITAAYAALPQYASEYVHAVVTPATLNFDATDWNVPQTVTITGQYEPVDEGHNTPFNVSLTPSSTDVQYANLVPQNVPVTAINNAKAGITVTAGPSMTISADGGTATFQVVLNSEPRSYVVLAYHSSDQYLGLVENTRLFFNPQNWNTPQTVTVLGVDNDNVYPDVNPVTDRTFQVEQLPSSSTDPQYEGLLPSALVYTNHDVDTPEILVAPTSGLVTTKQGGTATFDVHLNLQPTGPVIIQLHSSNTNEGTISPSTLTFTLDNFDQDQVVTVTGVNDGTGNSVAYTIISDAAASTDTRYSGLTPAVVSVTNVSLYQPPVATDKSYTAHKNITLVVSAANGVQVGDNDPGGYAMTSVVVAGPQHGTLTLNGDGSFTYVPNQTYTGPDSFTYQEQDQYSSSNVATVSLTVVDDPPTAVPPATPYSASNMVETEVSAAAGVLANDTDPNGDPLTAVLNTTTTHGVLTLHADGSFAYVPTTGYVGDDSFTYHAFDGTLGSSPVTVTIQVYSPAQVSQIAVNSDITQVQRSQILTLQITFNEAVKLGMTPVNAFQLVGPDGQEVNLAATITTGSGGATVATLSFLAGPDTYQLANGQFALNDGQYTLTVLKDQVHDAALHAMDMDVVDEFFRLFGDVNGNGVVDNADSLAFAKALNKSSGQAGYLWYLDYNDDGKIDVTTDYAQFKKRYGTKI